MIVSNYNYILSKTKEIQMRYKIDKTKHPLMTTHYVRKSIDVDKIIEQRQKQIKM